MPITGRVIDFNPELAKLGGGIRGDLSDPIRIDIDLGNVSWRLVSIDLENDLAEIEVEPSDEISVDTGKLDAEGNPIYETRQATEIEKQGFLDYARNLVEGHTKDELYAMSGMKRLVKSEEIMRKYREVHGGKKK